MDADRAIITYRAATAGDAEPIAQLHTLSWQQNYSGIWSDAFLNGPILENRRQVWQNRLSQPVLNQCVIVAERAETICGFACAYADDDPVWGTLLDNLHVRQGQQGQGIGTALIKSAARWSYYENSNAGFYLWVLAKNTSAQQFYKSLGATSQELASHQSPDGGVSNAYRYVWPDVRTLL